MNLRTGVIIAAALIATPGFVATNAAGAQSRAPADVVFVNGKVFTADDGDRVVQSFAITGDRFVATGGDSDVRR